MKFFYFGVLVFFCAQQEQSSAAVFRKAPAYAKPVFSNGYLPAAMQVIFHAVGQLKGLESEESAVSTTPSTTTMKTEVAATSPHPPGQHQPIFQSPTSSAMNDEALADNAVPEVPTTSPPSVISFDQVSAASPLPVVASVSTTTSATPSADTSTAPAIIVVDADRASGVTEALAGSAANAGLIGVRGTEEATDPNEAETPEGIYATPETNHETQEAAQEVQETVHEVAESNHEVAENTNDRTTSHSHETNEFDAKTTTVLPNEEDDSGENSSEESDEEKNSSEKTEEGRNGSESSEESNQDERDSAEEEDDEIRFTLIGEKVSQVPRPSLSNYLRKTVKSPMRSTTQDLAALYDALSKDARKQGLAKYSGFSDEVLKTLEFSAEGGIASQMRVLLEKTIRRKELTRDDAKSKVSSTLKNLDDPNSLLNRDLRPLIPLRYVP